MNEKDFVIWLKGYTDALHGRVPTQAEWDKIRHELALVFNKVTPYRPNMEAFATPLRPIVGQSVLGASGPYTHGAMISC